MNSCLAGPAWSAVDLTLLAGLATVVVLRHYRASMPVTLVGAVAVTALLRLWFSCHGPRTCRTAW